MTFCSHLAILRIQLLLRQEDGCRNTKGMVDIHAEKVFQLLVDNTSGVLSRIAGLFSRRGYNIESITAGVTADPRFTRITIVTSGDDDILEQIEKQVESLWMSGILRNWTRMTACTANWYWSR